MSSGTSTSSPSTALRQFANPTAGSSSAVTWPPWTMTPLAPIEAAAVRVCCRVLRLGMRMRLLVLATFIT
ncbi:Uncharacterised protein [Mycobacteroides abscessus subsp. abscessus]|nr:Uncharacterised protein [Mycobacteroides abscessus subsp. abscessus]